MNHKMAIPPRLSHMAGFDYACGHWPRSVQSRFVRNCVMQTQLISCHHFTVCPRICCDVARSRMSVTEFILPVKSSPLACQPLSQSSLLCKHEDGHKFLLFTRRPTARKLEWSFLLFVICSSLFLCSCECM